MAAKGGSQDLSKMFKGGAGKLGLDDEASSTLIANLNATTTPMCVGSPFDEDEQETDDFRLIFFVLDASGSMAEVEADVRFVMNEVAIPGLLGGSRGVVGAIRYAGLAFADRVTPLWGGGWLKLTDKLPKLGSDYRADGSTSLNQAVLDAVTAATAYALQVADITGTHPQVTIACLSDGANNRPPMDPAAVKHVMDSLSPELFRTAFFGFETFEPVDFKQIAASLGFRTVDESKPQPGETLEERQRRFRHDFGVFSSDFVTGSTQKQGGNAPSTPSAPSGFWKE